MSIDRTAVTVTGRKYYESSREFADCTIRKIREMLKKEHDPAIDKGVATILGLDGRTQRAEDNAVVKAGQIVKFELERIQAVETTKAVKNELSKLVDEMKDVKPQAKPIRLNVDIDLKAHADKENAMPKPKKAKSPKRISKIVKTCKHGTWKGFSWCGHARQHPECRGKAAAQKEVKAAKEIKIVKLVPLIPADKHKAVAHTEMVVKPEAAAKPNGMVGSLIGAVTKKAQSAIKKAESNLRATQNKLTRAQAVHARLVNRLTKASDTVLAIQNEQKDTSKTIEELKGLIGRLS